MTALAQFDKALESLLGTKAPGVSGSKVQELTKLAVQNVKVLYTIVLELTVQDNAQFITHLYKHFRLSPGTHKLGVLYVVDSISRMYQEQARRHGQDISTTTDDATFAGGLRHITSVLPSLLNDIIQHAPDSQKVINLNKSKGNVRRNAHSFFLSHCLVISSSKCSYLSPFIFVERQTECEIIGKDKKIIRHMVTIKDFS